VCADQNVGLVCSKRMRFDGRLVAERLQ